MGRGAGRPGYAPTTVHKAHQVLSKALRAAVDARRLRYNPADNVPLPRVERQEMRFIGPREIAHLAEHIDPRYRHFVFLAGYGGLRVGEVAGLTWAHVDLLRRHVDVVQNVVEVNGAMVINPPKTRAGRRRVPIPQVVASALAASTAPEPPARRLGRPGTGGRAAPGAAVPSPFLDAGSRARGLRGPAHPRPPPLCRGAVIAAGASPNEVAARAGHRSVVTVLDRYGHLLPERRDEVTDALDRMARG